METMIKDIMHVAFNVSDMKRTLEFYQDVFGFEKAFEMNHPKTGEPWIVYLYAGNEQFIELFYGGENYRDYQDCNIGFSHLCFAVNDIEKTAQKIISMVGELDVPVQIGIDNNWQCWTHDPDGNRIEIMQIQDNSLQKKYMNEKF